MTVFSDRPLRYLRARTLVRQLMPGLASQQIHKSGDTYLMSTYEITQVRTETTTNNPHEHITRVRLKGETSGEGFSRATIIADLKDPNGDRYYTYGGGERATVVVRDCPKCSRSDYITTLPDSTTKNNLLSLPRF
jgi:hypothetical protein